MVTMYFMLWQNTINCNILEMLCKGGDIVQAEYMLFSGVPKQDDRRQCSGEVGILLSQAAMRTACGHIAECSSVGEEHSHAIQQCIGQASDVQCTDITNVSSFASQRRHGAIN